MVAFRKSPPYRMTVTEFLSWDFRDQSGHAWQLIDDEPVVNSARMEAELLRRDADSTWPEVPLRTGPADALVLESIGFSVPLAMLYRTATLAMPGGNPP